MSLEAAMADLTEALNANTKALNASNAGRDKALAAAESLNKGAKDASPKDEETPRRSRARDADKEDDAPRSRRSRDEDEEPRRSRARDTDKEDDAPRSRRDSDEDAPRSSRRGGGSSAKPKTPTDDQIRAAFGDYLGVDDEDEREDRKDWVLDMLDFFDVKTSVDLKPEDRQQALDWLADKQAGKKVKFQ